MAKLSILGGATSVTDYIFVQDSASTVGAGKTGLAYNTTGLSAYYVRPGAASQAVSLVTQTVTGAYSSGGFVEVDAVNLPGVYRIDYPNAMLAAGVRSAVMMLKGTGIAPVKLEIELTGWDNQVSKIAATLAASDVTGNLPTNVIQVNGTAQTARDLGASVLLAGDFSATMKTSLNASTVATVTNLTNAPTNGDLTATMKASIATSVSGVTAAVTAITTNTARGRTVIPDQMELPASGSTSYEINLNIYTLQGAMDAPDSAPTIHARTVGGASMDASLRSTAMTLISAGVYNVTYSVASTDIQQQILFTFAWAVGGVPFTLTGTTDVVNVYAVAFTSADRTALNAIPTTPLLTSDTRLNHLNADISAIPIAPLLASDTRLNHLNADISAIPIAPLLAVNYTAPDSASIIATAVWAAGGRTLTSFGTLVADAAAAVWGAVSRTLTAFAFIPTVDKTGYTLDSAQRVKLDASQPDYVPAKESDVTTITTAISNISDPFSEVIPESNPAMTYGQALARLTVPSTLPVIPILALPTTTYQILYGNTKEFAATAWSVGDIATMTISSSQIINGVIIEPAIRTCTLDSTGLFSFTPDIGLTNILITISNFRGIYFSKAISLINTNSSMNISDY